MLYHFKIITSDIQKNAFVVAQFIAPLTSKLVLESQNVVIFIRIWYNLNLRKAKGVSEVLTLRTKLMPMELRQGVSKQAQVSTHIWTGQV